MTPDERDAWMTDALMLITALMGHQPGCDCGLKSCAARLSLMQRAKAVGIVADCLEVLPG